MNNQTYPYNHYPNTMINLCNISYEKISDIKASVEATGQTIVWGPQELVSDVDVAYSLMYVAFNEASREYTVVIRGTNFDSWSSWTKQDFAVGNTQPFNSLPCTVPMSAPTSVLISQGTFNGMKDLISLKDPSTGLNVVEFFDGLLKVDKNFIIYVTGHSLGGTLTPPMFAYLNDQLFGGGYVSRMASWSFAGLTAGDGGFNTYFNSISNPEFPWRIHNDLDIAPLLWYAQNEVENIYTSNDLSWGWPEDDFINKLFEEASGIGYEQPLGDHALTGTFDSSIIEEFMWTAQALHQHHSTTYKTLIATQFPL